MCSCPSEERPEIAIESSRRSRWKRRRSDGASFSTEVGRNGDSSEDTLNDDSFNEDAVSGIGTKTADAETCIAARLLHHLWYWSNHEPLHLTAEFRRRVAAAARASAASLLVFSLLVATGQETLPAMWIGNVLTQSTLKDTLGDTVLAVRDVVIPLIPVAALSWVISLGLDSLQSRIYSIVLPFVVMMGTVTLLMCPWPFLTSKNLMLVVFYLIVASPLALRLDGVSTGDDAENLVELGTLGPWFVPRFVGTCLVGLAVPLALHITLAFSPWPTTATSCVPNIIKSLDSETNDFLLSVAQFLRNIGVNSQSARRSRSLINLHVCRRGESVAELKRCVAAVKMEEKLHVLSGLLYWKGRDLGDVVALLENQQKQAEMARMATTQQLLGEDFTIRSDAVRGIKTMISQNLGTAMVELASSHNDAQKEYLGSFMIENREVRRTDSLEALLHSLRQYRGAMKRAVTNAEVKLINEDIDTHIESTTAPLIRVRVIFNSCYAFVAELVDQIEASMSPGEESALNGEDTVSTWSYVQSLVSTPWPWGDWTQRRFSLKSALGLGLVTLWVSIPLLRENIAHPNSVWPGLTVASVTLGTTGAAFQKCIDRLWGTLIAAAVSLIVGTFVSLGEIAKILAVGAFTFVAIFFRNPKRPYAYNYAATSLGSILYGSFDINLGIDDYVPNRIMLIFVGIVTFLVVEVLLFPRSSRTIMQAKSIQFFEDTEQFLTEARKIVESIPLLYRHDSSDVTQRDVEVLLVEDPLWMLRQGQKEMTHLADGLCSASEVAKMTMSEVSAELEPGISEPDLGLAATLNAEGYRDLLREQKKCLAQFPILISSIQSLMGYYSNLEREDPVRSLHWPMILSGILSKSIYQLCACCDGLRAVFPHGLCRPTCGRNTSEIMKAVSCFRDFEDIRLLSLAEWSERHRSYLDSVRSTGKGVAFAPGFRLTLALAVSSVLEIDRCLQSCGEHLETIVMSFPKDS